LIIFIAAYPNTQTFNALRGSILAPLTPESEAITYDDLFAADELKPATYVFTDMERLHPLELRLASQYFRQLGRLPGFRVLNDPARVRARYGLLRALARAGLNDFDVYWADGFPRPNRFPVFLRIASDHIGPIGDLIDDQAALDARLNEIEADGIPLAGVLVIEFSSSRNQWGLYEKFSIFRVGTELVLSGLLVGPHWVVKDPAAEARVMTPDILQDQCMALRENRHAEALRAAFDIAGIEYGRADVGICDGRLQVYEINTNPTITASHGYMSEEHRGARQAFRDRFGAMLHRVDSKPAEAFVAVNLGRLDQPLATRREVAKALVAARSSSSTLSSAYRVNAQEFTRRGARRIASHIARRLKRTLVPST